MTDRILSIIKYFNLSPSDFAEEIGVQRSSISHLISGRNKPSLEFVQKILVRFPEINPDWILSGKGEMLRNGISSIQGTLPFEKPAAEIQMSSQVAAKQDFSKVSLRRKPVETEGRQVEKIIYLYRDKTFREYFPE
jgi:transcriptional regulator with XRE-family HTH domain